MILERINWKFIDLRPAIRYLPAAVAAWYFYKHFVKPFLSPLRKIPGCPYRPIVGNLLETIKGPANSHAIRWMQKYKSRIIRFYTLGGEGAVLIGDPALAKQVFVTNSKNYYRPVAFGVLRNLLPGFLAFLNGDEHHAMRRLVNPVFSHQAVGGFVPTFEETVRKIINIWQTAISTNNGTAIIPAQNYMTKLTLDAICQCGFDYEMQSIEKGETKEVKAFKSILGGLQLSFLQLLSLNWLPTIRNRQIKADIELFRSTIRQVISAKQVKMAEGKTSKDILSLLLQATDENGQHLSEESICAQVGGFLFAGFETTNTSLTWALICLAENQEVQEKARQEVMSLLPDNSQAVDQKILENLSYLTCVIQESLRLHTPLSTIFRRAQRDDYLSGYFIPAGTLVGLNLGALHRLPDIWPDPMTFRPERFLGGYDKFSFLPFLTGPYMCVGHLFSMAETKTTLALLLRHFRFSLPDGYTYKVVRKLTIQPVPALELVVSLV